MQAAKFLLARGFAQEELAQINDAKEYPMIELEFKDGLRFRRMTFENGIITELYRNERDRYRITYDPNAQTVKTQREPRS